MLKEVIGRIIEAEARAEKIENDAFLEAEKIKRNAMLEAERLKTHPSEQVKERAEFILNEARSRALKMSEQKLASSCNVHISDELIDSAADLIVSQFLKRGLQK